MADEVTAVSACIGAEKPEKNLTSSKFNFVLFFLDMFYKFSS